MTGPELVVGGPHCWHDDCGHGECEQTGHVEFPCTTPGCVMCGAPDRTAPETWGGDLARYLAMSEEEQVRVRAYWQMYPLVRTATDVLPEIDTARGTDALRAALAKHDGP